MSPYLPFNVSCRRILSSAFSCFLIFLLLFISSLNSFAASPGALDYSFGTGGIVTTSLDALSAGTKVLLQPDGKIIAAGYIAPGFETSDFVLVRYLPNGAIDTTFGNNGVVITDMSLSPNVSTADSILSGALQADGKIVVVGYSRLSNPPTPIAPSSAYAVARFHPNGTLDTTFDGDGKIIGERWHNIAVGVVVQPDGKIIYTGTRGRCGDCGSKIFIESFRLNPDGTPDNNFGAAGKAVTEMPAGDMKAAAIRLQADGKIIIGGFGSHHTMPGFTVARLKPDGTLDTGFGTGGIVYNGSFSNPSGLSEIIIQPDGKIIGGRSVDTGANNHDLEISRLNADGTFDTTFDIDGKVVVAPSSNYDTLTDILLQPDGKIIAVGESQTLQQQTLVGATLTRFNPNGSIDRTFGTGGTTFTPNKSILDAEFQIDGKLVTAGTGITVMRYRTLGARDFDYDSDGKTDISVFRPSVGDWYISRSANGSFLGTNFGLQNDLIAPADFDGDGRIDISVFRPANGTWYRLNSSNNTFSAHQFGASGDQPAPGDFDGDGRADLAVFRPSAGSWYRINSLNNQFSAHQFGIAEDKAIVGDFDGDGKSDLAVFRPSNGTWYRINSGSDTFSAFRFGIAEDKTVAADYDGDGRTDLAVYRPSNSTWYRINSNTDSFSAHQFGIAEDRPLTGDFDGDNRADLAVFRPSSGTWYVLRSTAGFTGVQFGANGDVPTPNAFVR